MVISKAEHDTLDKFVSHQRECSVNDIIKTAGISQGSLTEPLTKGRQVHNQPVLSYY